MIIRNAVHCAVPSVEYFSWNSACNNRNLVVMDQVRGRGWGSVEYYYWSHVGSIHIYKLARQIKSQEEKWKTQPNTKKRKGKKKSHHHTELQDNACYAGRPSVIIIIFTSGQVRELLPLSKYLFWTELQIWTTIYMQVFIINIRKTKSSIR